MCQNYNAQSGCKFREKWSFLHQEGDRQSHRRTNKGVEKAPVALVRNVKRLGCVFQDVEPPKSKSILRRAQNPRDPSAVFGFREKRYIGSCSTKSPMLKFAFFVVDWQLRRQTSKDHVVHGLEERFLLPAKGHCRRQCAGRPGRSRSKPRTRMSSS